MATTKSPSRFNRTTMQPARKARRRRTALHERAARRTQTHRVFDLGATRRNRKERHVSGAPVLGERRAPELRAPAADRRHNGAGLRA